MPLDAAEYKQQVIEEVGDTPSGILAANIDRYWRRNDREGTLELQFYKTKVTAINVVLGQERRTNVDQVGLGNVSFKAQQRIKTLEDMLAATKLEYAQAVEGQSTRNGGAFGELETKAPVTPPAWAPDANSLVYAGNPYLKKR